MWTIRSGWTIKPTAPIIGQERALRRLGALLQRESIPHALLFAGMDGVGKRTAALRFAMACNCRSGETPSDAAKAEGLPYCGRCDACRKIAAGTHPDIHLTVPAGAAIRIDQVRALCGQLAMKPYEARYRFAILSDAQTLNAEAANALLKLLEEPPDGTVLILTTEQTSDLLPTIVSRCQPVRFDPIPRRTLAAHLETHHGMSAEAAAAAAVMANGSFARAVDADLADWIPRRRWLIRQAETLSRSSTLQRLALAERMARDKAQLAETLTMLKLWYRDLLVWIHDPERIVNTDMADRIDPAARQETVPALLAKIDAIGMGERALSGNANPRLAMEVLVQQLSGHGRDPHGPAHGSDGLELTKSK